MEKCEYIVADIQGDYAYLKRLDKDSKDLFMIAMALLPMEINIGTKLLYENLEYSII